jgi:F-type H+-transporting ATPase subunit b
VSGAKIFEIFLGVQAWAAEAAEHGVEHHAPSINDIWFPLGNFLIYLFIIVKYALPLVRDFLKNRREEVVATIAQASAKKQAAEALVNEYKAKVAGLDREIQAMQNSLRQDGEREKAKLVSEAQTLAAKIKVDAQFLADQEVKMARQRVRQDMADQAEATARELVQRHLSTADQSRLAEEFIQSIGHVQ